MYQASEHRGPVVSANSRKTVRQSDVEAIRGSEKPRSLLRRLFGSLSVKFLAYASAVVIIALFLAVTAANLILAKSYYQGSEKNGISQRLADKAEAIEAQLSFFQQIVNHVAVQPTTQDILEYKDVTSAQAWALQMRRFVPQAMGVALLTDNGTILGVPAEQPLSPQSLTDLAKLSQKESVSQPPVHRSSPATTHYDLVAPVLDEADNHMGMLFVSFGLDTLQPLINNSTNSEQELVLRDGQGNVIARHSRLQNNNKTQQGKMRVGNTDWELSLTEDASRSLPSFLSLSIFNVSAFLLIVGTIAFIVRYAMCSLNTDFGQLKSLLTNLAEGETVDAENMATPQLRETAEILPSISHIQRDLDKKQQLLESHQLSDEVTGLPNRRQFNLDFARAYDFARRGTPVCVTLLRLQGLDKLNARQAEQVSKLLAKTLKAQARKVDHIARLEADQFALLMFGMSAEGATPCLQRLQQGFQQQQAQHPAISQGQECQLSCGYTLIHAHRDNNAAEVLKRAATALDDAEDADGDHIVNA
jgi:diguanylate cyclase (GGDEF)-like protein